MNLPITKMTIPATGFLLSLLIAACVQDQKPTEESQRTPVPDPALPASTQTVLTDNIRPERQLQPLSAQVLRSEAVADSVQVSGMSLQAAKFNATAVAPQQLNEAVILQRWQTGMNRDNYAQMTPNSVKRVTQEPVSTFSIDVDTAAYALVRRHLEQGILPPSNAVRTEELINYFDYQYPRPLQGEAPFTVSTEFAPTPWNPDTHLLQIGLQGYQPDNEARSAANLVFLIDVSGSMQAANKLPLLKNAFRLLVNQLNENDRISMVVYAGSSGVALEPTPGNKKGSILAALERLSAGGSTHGSAGIQLAYSMAGQSFIKGGINRVILATDGDFNVGTVDHAALLDLIERNKTSGISLTTLGFGDGNYNDHLMEQLADHGDGNYAYIDNLSEARKTLVQQISATLETIASDVKIQIEWNPAVVSEYRLIGYENRLLKREDFNNDKVDAGEIGAGHSVTALYEITLADSAATRIEPLRYQAEKVFNGQAADEIAYLKLRYKKPGETHSRLIQHALTKDDVKSAIDTASTSLRFAAAVAAFGELLRGAENLRNFSYQDVLKLARTARGEDPHGYRGEYIRLVELAAALDSTH